MGQTYQDVVPAPTHVAAKPTDRDICDAYLYLLGRLLVLAPGAARLPHRDFRWNMLVHRAVGGVAWANPNLDVAYSEAWLALDDSSCTILDVPKIMNRYYTVQLLNMWGETIVNINERTYPYHPFGSVRDLSCGTRTSRCLRACSGSMSLAVRRACSHASSSARIRSRRSRCSTR